MKLKVIVAAIGIMFVSACTMGYDELQAMCKKDAGTVIYERVEVDGYYSDNCTGPCWSELLHDQFEFVEIYNPTERDFYNPGKGYWHIYLSKQGDENCYSRVTSRQEHRLDSGQCIAFKKIDKPTAIYGYKHELSDTFILKNYYGSEISKYITTAYRISDNKVLAESVDYRLDRDPSTTGDGGGVGCKRSGSGKEPLKYMKTEVFE
ncbi:hypothetical protein [Kangiella geojedonensis]|uniref:Lipoprotein n=1 Tax=Kangiella geojedonensis TaxID=914150 RepID=A0A0F6RBY2_9GAMM|nr:hypothetical protein [Kangiella geojedonensis]AKE51561.1 hypothetical protein TQ33_0580 [Kangiella geojedonensis]